MTFNGNSPRATSFAPREKLLLYPLKLAAFAERKDFAPVLVEISPSNLCNAKCPTCPFVASDYKQHHTREFIDQATMLAALDDMEDMGVEAINWSGGGEPSIHPHINEFINAAHAHDLKQGIFTNGIVPILRPALMEWIRITVTERLEIPKIAAKYAENTRTGVNVNLAPWNQDHLKRLVLEARAAGVHYFQVRPALADSYEIQRPVEVPSWLKDYERDGFEVLFTDYKYNEYLKPHNYPKCWGHTFVPFLWHNGDLAVCAYHYGREQFTFGNVRKGGFRGVWESERRRTMLVDGVPVIPSCQTCCKNHEINKGLSAIRGEYALASDRSFL